MTQTKVHNRGKVSDKESGKCSIYSRTEKDHHHAHTTPLCCEIFVTRRSPWICWSSAIFSASNLTDEQGLQHQSSWGSERFVWCTPLRTIHTESYYCVQEHPVRLLQSWGGSLGRCYIVFWQLQHHFHWKTSPWKEVTFQCSL